MPDTAVVAQISGPGVFYDMPDDVYHSDPAPGGSLSSTGARKLLPPSCPAKFRHEQQHGRRPTAAFDFGHAAHKEVLGVGAPLVLVDADDWRTKRAKAEREEAHAARQTPLLAYEYEQVQAMAKALREHSIASALLRPDMGRAEVSLFWPDHDTAVMRRCRIDWLRDNGPGRHLLVDYKSTVSAEPEAVAKAIENYGYHQQADYYLDGAYSLGVTGDASFLFVFQEKVEPYLVTVAQPDADALAWGAVLNRKAIDVYRGCTETGRWPGYTDEIVLTALPTWARRKYEYAQQRGDFELETVH